MKALVVRQPWATLIALGVKSIETRPAPPNGPMRPDGVRGLPGLAVERGERIAIVAGATPPEVGLRLGVDAPITTSEFLVTEGWRLLDLCNEEAHPLPLGAVVCTVVVDDALPICGGEDGGDLLNTAEAMGRNLTAGGGLWLDRWPDEDHGHRTSMPDQLPLGDFTPGRWGWVLTDPRPCEPVPCKGRQGVFALPDDVAGAIR